MVVVEVVVVEVMIVFCTRERAHPFRPIVCWPPQSVLSAVGTTMLNDCTADAAATTSYGKNRRDFLSTIVDSGSAVSGERGGVHGVCLDPPPLIRKNSGGDRHTQEWKFWTAQYSKV